MKQLMLLLLSLSVLLSACNSTPKTEDKKTVNADGTTETPKVEVKVKQSDDARKKIEAAKERGRKKSSTAEGLDTDKYNQAKSCLTEASMADTKTCTDIENSVEYSRAWNNLTAEGYICQHKQCEAVEQPEPATETPTTESPSSEAATEQPVSTEIIKPGGLSTEAPQPDVAP
ncbi:hypothetical protein ERX35_009700 [Macrococcus equipercicus]|uniref:Lipoprotein n=1 Tax=Macrococcus equipercicus TaxID=69967 RepID=A0ABQ6R703_9STAP|nr:hypothetical protein [Macrococcus equipercicus]KAA1037641.1 hypothetical protein ERX35_009700 [Macrococcus equipercicus]